MRRNLSKGFTVICWFISDRYFHPKCRSLSACWRRGALGMTGSPSFLSTKRCPCFSVWEREQMRSSPGFSLAATFVFRCAATAWEFRLTNAGESFPADAASMCFALGRGRSRRNQHCSGSCTDDLKICTIFFVYARCHSLSSHPKCNLQLWSILRRDSLCVPDAARKRYRLCGRETRYRASGFPPRLPGSCL